MLKSLLRRHNSHLHHHHHHHHHRHHSWCSSPSTLVNQHRSYNIVFFGSDQFSLYSLTKLHEYTVNSHGEHSLCVMVPEELTNNSRTKSAPVKHYCQQHNIPFVHPESLTKLKLNDLHRLQSLFQQQQYQHAQNSHDMQTDTNNTNNTNNTKNHEQQQQPASPPSSPSPLPPQFDIGVAVSFRYFIPKSILNQFSIATLNVHPSLLPQYRGPAPIHHTLLNGDTMTGVSIIDLNPEAFDVGQIWKQDKTSVGADECYDSLHHRLGVMGSDMIVTVVDQVHHYQQLALDQNEFSLDNQKDNNHKSSQVLIHAKKITPDLKYFDWNRDACHVIYNKWRALGVISSPFNPSSLSTCTTANTTNTTSTTSTTNNDEDTTVCNQQKKKRDDGDDEYLFIELHRRPAQDPLVIQEMLRQQQQNATTTTSSDGGGSSSSSYLYDSVLQSLYIKAADGQWLGCTMLQKPGKRAFTAQEFHHQQLVKQKNKDISKAMKSKKQQQ